MFSSEIRELTNRGGSRNYTKGALEKAAKEVLMGSEHKTCSRHIPWVKGFNNMYIYQYFYF